MTHTEIYRAWHTLPEYFKKEVRRDYAKALEANELDPKNERIDAHINFLEKYFGKHNLTASEEEKPKFKSGYKIGDKVVVTGSLCESKGQTITLVKHYDVPREANDYNKLWVGLLADGGTRSFAEKDFTPLVELEEESSCGESNPSLSNPSNIGKDWLAYRMELAKAITPTLVASCNDDATPTDTIDVVMQIVDGIVERLKGGENGKV